ncbi:hypothetical protein BBP40_010895 [Aspergillus hancockii]|nr:hypothetical protein BBP40_010895 [Aspergillus hancockii]
MCQVNVSIHLEQAIEWKNWIVIWHVAEAQCNQYISDSVNNPECFIGCVSATPGRARRNDEWLFPEVEATVLTLSGETLADVTSSLIYCNAEDPPAEVGTALGFTPVSLVLLAWSGIMPFDGVIFHGFVLVGPSFRSLEQT